MPQSAVLPPTYVGSDTGHFFLSTVSSLGKENIVKESPRGQKVGRLLELIGGRYTLLAMCPVISLHEQVFVARGLLASWCWRGQMQKAVPSFCLSSIEFCKLEDTMV